MNRKNIFIAIATIGAGVILYKLLLGFFLPIALFLALGYVLKFLLKVADSESFKEAPQVLTKRNFPSSIENIVEIQPIEKGKTIKEDLPTEEINHIKEDQSTEEDRNAEEGKPS